MNITSKSRYALKIMIDLAQHFGEIVHRADISRRQGVPLDYMDHILSRLRDGQVIASIRGRSGGYKMVRDPKEISVFEIFNMVEDAFQPVICLDGGEVCPIETKCGSKDAWSEIASAITKALSGIMLSSIIEKGTAGIENLEAAAGMAENFECRSPRKSVAGGNKRSS